MIKFERTFDQDYIRDCMKASWSAVSQEYFGIIDPELYFPPMHDRFYWLKCGEYGVFLGIQHGDVYDCHVALTPNAKGQAVEIAKQAMRWFFDNTSCNKLVASVPTSRPVVERLAVKIGMEPTGYEFAGKKTFEITRS